MSTWGPVLIPTIVLLAGVIDDLRSRKVHNYLVLTLAALAFTTTFIFGGLPGVKEGLLAFLTALAIGIPLTLARVVGAGDMKLLAAFALATNWSAVVTVSVASVFWGALLGVVRALLGRDLGTLMATTWLVMKRQKPEAQTLHHIPYSVALFFGWLTHLTLSRLPPGVLW